MILSRTLNPGSAVEGKLYFPTTARKATASRITLRYGSSEVTMTSKGKMSGSDIEAVQ